LFFGGRKGWGKDRERHIWEEHLDLEGEGISGYTKYNQEEKVRKGTEQLRGKGGGGFYEKEMTCGAEGPCLISGEKSGENKRIQGKKVPGRKVGICHLHRKKDSGRGENPF